MVTAHVFSALILLISASLLSKTIATYKGDDLKKTGLIQQSICKILEKLSSDARCDQLTIAVVST
jgi:hypothetical protein